MSNTNEDSQTRTSYLRRISDTIRDSMFIQTVRCFFVFYALVGLPHGFQTRYLPIYFRIHGMSLARVGMFRLLVLPWLFKGLWTAFIDRNTDVRQWLKASLAFLIILCLIAAHFPPTSLGPVVVILFVFNTITAIQDTAIDTMLIDAFTSSQLLMGNVAQAVGARVGSIISGGVFTWYMDVLSWYTVHNIMAGLYAGGLLTAYAFLPDWRGANRREEGLERRTSRSSVIDQAMHFWDDSSQWMTFFVLIYKIGEAGVLSLLPLFLIDKKIEASEVGFWVGIVAQSLSVVGSTSVLFFTFRSILSPMAVLNSLTAVFVGLSWLLVLYWEYNPSLCYTLCLISILSLTMIGGAVSTYTQTLLMQMSQLAPPDDRAQHYAIYSFGELLAKLLFAASVGGLAQVTSYGFVFGLCTLVSVAVVPFTIMAPTNAHIPMG